MSQPLTDAINALTTYANEVTGKSDETLSDAVESLADGYGGGGSGGSDQWAGMVDKTISEAIDRQGVCNTIGDYAFYLCSKLTTASFPNATYIGGSAFYSCRSLTTFNAPNVSSIIKDAFCHCEKLKTASFPNVSIIRNNAFSCCYNLDTIILGNSNAPKTDMYSGAFNCCYNLLSLYLLAPSLCWIQNINAFLSTPISDRTTSTGGVYGSIFVPESLYSTYIASTNWSVYSNRFVSLTDAQIQNVLTYGTHNPT